MTTVETTLSDQHQQLSICKRSTLIGHCMKLIALLRPSLTDRPLDRHLLLHLLSYEEKRMECLCHGQIVQRLIMSTTVPASGPSTKMDNETRVSLPIDDEEENDTCRTELQVNRFDLKDLFSFTMKH